MKDSGAVWKKIRVNNLAWCNLFESLFHSFWRLYALFFLLIVALKWSFFTNPPVWDEAFSIFPAADFLVNNGFDYSLLLEQPRYHEGGPTAHGLSLLTIVTALVLKVTGGGTPAWAILHVLQWLMAAAIGTMLTHIYNTVFERIPAFLLAVASLVYPVMLAQLGFMYLEVPVLFFTILAFSFFLNSWIWLASLFLVAACMTKGSALIGVGALTLTALICQDKRFTRRFADASILAIPALVSVKILMSVAESKPSITVSHEIVDIITLIIIKNINAYQRYVTIIPEMILVFSASIIFSIFYIVKYCKKDKKKEQSVMLFNSLFIIVFFIFYFFIFNYYTKIDSPNFLTRYIAYAIPSMFFVIYYIHDQILQNQRVKIVILLLLIMVFLVNRNGILYPPLPHITCNAMAERSEEYINGHLVQKEYIAMIEKKVPKDISIFVSLPDYFLTRYTVNQYVKEPLTNAQFIWHVVKELGPHFPYPNHFVLVYSYPWLGGTYIQRMHRKASMSEEYSVEVMGRFNKGAFSAHVYEIRRNSG